MIYQLPNGRIIEMSLEQYLSMDDQELQELNGLGNEFSSEAPNPFYKSSLKDIARGKVDKPTDNNADSDYIQEREPTLDEISDMDKLLDEYYHPDDI
tara:strand:- start:282 stop:572 length:291 start_codon:yes stop_codon:yes gene_type:complete